ncbi:MAG TPA: HAMP domain-containing sensor histidine kinase, partial [Spirochaetota bacterium]|nr:HAMP domain-containing sensor histidine kinase [Spirochaetota bacterium]
PTSTHQDLTFWLALAIPGLLLFLGWRLFRNNRRLRETLTRAQRLASIGTMAGAVAHEINNPLMSMINLAQVIADRSQDAGLRDLANEIITEGERIAKISHNLLDFTRSTHSAVEICDLTSIVRDAVSLTERLFEKQGISLRVSGLDQSALAQCHPGEIRQVILNLLCNARDALNERYPESHENKSIEIALERSATTAEILLRVSDTGHGIPHHIAPHIFKPFYTTKPEHSGTGLGLAITREIVTRHGGSISFTSSPDEGTSFLVLIPEHPALSV